MLNYLTFLKLKFDLHVTVNMYLTAVT